MIIWRHNSAFRYWLKFYQLIRHVVLFALAPSAWTDFLCIMRLTRGIMSNLVLRSSFENYWCWRKFEKDIFILAILNVIFFFFFLGLEKNESVPIPVIPLPSVPSTEQKEESVQISISVTTNQVRARKIKTIRFRKSGATEVGINKGIAGSMIRSNFLLDFACLPLRIYVGGKIAGKKITKPNKHLKAELGKNFNFQWTRALNQNNLNNIAFFFLHFSMAIDVISFL